MKKNYNKKPETPAKLGISEQKGANKYYDKSSIYLPRNKMIAQAKTQCYQGFVRFYQEKPLQFYTK